MTWIIGPVVDWAGPGDQASRSGRSVYGKRPRDEPERLAPRDSLAWKPQCCGRILGRTVFVRRRALPLETDGT